MDSKKIIKVIFIDFTSVLLGILNAFIIPKFLSLDGYVYIKTFTLYISYSGMLHLGFSDGLYILLGGKSISDVKKEKIKGYLISLMKLVSILLLVIWILNLLLIKDGMVNYFILYTFPFQITLFFSLIYRATGELNEYTKIRVIMNLFQLLATISVVLNKNPFIYVMIQIIGCYILAIMLSVRIFSDRNNSIKIQLDETLHLIRIGFLIMIGNTTNNLIFSLDKWIVKLNFSDEKFAFYSFGTSMLTLFVTLIGSLSIVFYPYIAKEKENVDRDKVKRCIFLISSLAPSGYFCMEFVVNNFLEKYSASLSILGILILTIPFMSIINIFYVNLYKVLGKGRLYLVSCIKILILSLILNLALVAIFKDVIVVAVGTLITLVIWYYYSARHFSKVKFDLKEYTFIGIYLLGYFVLTNVDIFSLAKAIIYSGLMILVSIILYKNELKFILKLVTKKIG